MRAGARPILKRMGATGDALFGRGSDPGSVDYYMYWVSLLERERLLYDRYNMYSIL